MNISLDDLRSAVASKLAQLLTKEKAGWYDMASWIDGRALKEGIDLYADFESPKSFSCSFVEGMRFHADLNQRFPKGAFDVEQFQSVVELFWHLMPHRESDYSANQE